MTSQALLPQHTEAVRVVHARLLSEAGLSGGAVPTADGADVHVVDSGTGRPVVLIHGSGSPALFWLPLLTSLGDIRALAVDRPGFGLSDPAPPARATSDGAVDWVGSLLDALHLASATLVGHSMGGLWSLRFALAHPERVDGLAMIGTPSLRGTRAPLPFRVMATPVLGALVARQRETPRSVRQFAAMVGEGGSLEKHPELIDLLVAVGNDPVAKRATHREVRALLSPWALFGGTGFRRSEQVAESVLPRLDLPTLLLWGDHDPVGGSEVARRLQHLIPGAELELFDGGHAPWLAHHERMAAALLDWLHRLP